MVGSAAAAGSGMMKFLKPSMRPQSTDLQAAVGWGVAGACAAVYLIQPWGWIKRTFFEKQEEQKLIGDV